MLDISKGELQSFPIQPRLLAKEGEVKEKPIRKSPLTIPLQKIPEIKPMNKKLTRRFKGLPRDRERVVASILYQGDFFPFTECVKAWELALKGEKSATRLV